MVSSRDCLEMEYGDLTRVERESCYVEKSCSGFCKMYE